MKKGWYYAHSNGVEGVFLVVRAATHRSGEKIVFFIGGYYSLSRDEGYYYGFYGSEKEPNDYFYLSELTPASPELVEEWKLKWLMFKLET